jgi:hypothetical protein
MKTYRQTKIELAATYGYSSWDMLLKGSLRVQEIEEEAAELYADSRSRKAANEAVKKDREDLNKVCEAAGCYISRTINNRPLPFPEES